MNILLKLFLLHLYIELLFVLKILNFEVIKHKLNDIRTHFKKFY